ncbi:transglycosylase domain-containing protein [Lusitaniella coriacea]|uniref:transglycosylase domain-containing protein n=1 Tax=Lusitaniella coriacea TaxID=1983105 RepID=UPI003CE8CFF7
MSKFIRNPKDRENQADRLNSGELETNSSNIESNSGELEKDAGTSQENPKTLVQNPAVTSEPSPEAAGEIQNASEPPKKLRRRSTPPYQVLARRLGLSLLFLFGEYKIHRRLWFWLLLGAGGGAIALGVGWQKLEASLPTSAEELSTFAREGTITIKAVDGSAIQEMGPVSHEVLDIKQIPDTLTEAFIAIEDRRFPEHSGVDYWGVVRAAVANLRAGDVVEGGSTITQQLARIVFLNQERRIWRKLREVRLAQKIENQYSKDEILEYYLNLVYLGSGAYGVADASWIYFGKPVRDLTIAEAATIAGITPAPSNYSPLENKEKALKRRNLVLERMEKEEFITPAQAKAAIASPLIVDPKQPKRLSRTDPYFADYIQKELPKYLSPQQLNAGGIVVETTLHPSWQNAAEKAVEQGIETYGSYQNFTQAALVAIDPRNGEIRAMVGGKDYSDKDENGQFNRVTQAQRQPGSTFKTFVYATAIAAGFSPYRGLRDDPYTVDGYTPKNYDDDYRGWISLKDALVYSRNIPAVRTLIQVGWDPTIKIAEKMGVESELKSTYSLALGASEVNLLELTSAYGTLANQGVYWKPHGIRRIINRDGEVIYHNDFKSEKALDEDSTAIMTWILRGVITQGTGKAAQIGRPAAGKTGTTDESRDLWFVGYVPQLVAGVWLGNDDNDPTWGTSSSAAAVWRKFMVNAIEWLPEEDFPKRPDKVEGREGSIKAKPIKPKRAYYKKKKRSNSESSGSSSGSRRRSRSSGGNSGSSSGSRSRSSGNRSSGSRSSGSSGSRSSGSRNRSSSPSRSSSPPRQRSAPAPAPRQSAPPPKAAPPAPAPAPAPAPIPEIKKPKKAPPSAPAPAQPAPSE